MKHYNNKARQAGMTLIELTVVLLVLIGLAGLMIPYVSGFISKTHDSTGTNNLARLNNNIQRYQGQFMSLPDDLQSLVETSSTNIYGDLINMNMGDNLLTAATYTADGAAAIASSEIPLVSLARVGISSFVDMKDNVNATSKTFDAANAPVSVPNAMSATDNNSINLAKVQIGDAATIEAHLADTFGMQETEFNAACNDYIVAGIGQESQLIGRSMADAPVHFAQNGDMGPNNKYNRFVAVFEVDKANGSTTFVSGGANDLSRTTALGAQDCGDSTHAAKFIGTAMLMMDSHLRGLAHEMNHTYENIANN